MASFLTQFAATETAQKSGLAVLGIDPKALMLQLITFLIIFFLIKKFALGPIVGALNQRRKTINDGIRLGRKMEEEQAKFEETVASTLQKARAEADRIVSSAHHEAGEIIKTAEQLAAQNAKSILDEAKARIETLAEQTKEALKQETVELVAEASSAVIKEKVDPRKDASLIKQALEAAK